MAYQEIDKRKVFEYSKEIEGTLVNFWLDVIVEQETFPDENRSNFNFKYVFNSDIGTDGDLTDIEVTISQNRYSYTHIGIDDYLFAPVRIYRDTRLTLQPGSYNGILQHFNTEGQIGTKNDYRYTLKPLYHNINGVMEYMSIYASTQGAAFKITGGVYIDIYPKINNEYLQSEVIQGQFEFVPNAIKYDRTVYPTTASNFNDEQNPTLNYKAPITAHSIFDSAANSGADTIKSLQAALSLDGTTLDVGYRDIPVGGGSYTFILTDAERELLREKTKGSATNNIYYLVKVVRDINGISTTLISKTQRVLTIVGCTPTLNPVLKDVNSDTIALTGNPNIFVRYESMVEYSTGATASKHAYIVSQSVQNGSKIVSGQANGVIADIESRDFIFNATDSRGLHANQVVVSNSAMIEYVKPTCKQDLEINLSGETGAIITLTMSGNYYNGSFGKVNNSLLLEYRYGVSNEELGNWTKVTETPNYSGTTYELVKNFGGLDYSKGYIFQCRATDKLNLVETSQYTVKLLPVFDWSETDFNFNVPVNIDADTLSLHGRDILKHNTNTVLASKSGNIYLRPKGADSETGQTIIYNDGRVKFGGDVIFSDGTTRSLGAPDYIVEIGDAAMGSNGTWYWAKWNSGKAEAWGCRNYGNMAVNTAWGNLYRSEIFTQNLPDNVFARTPDVININPVSVSNGCWIVKHENSAPSAATTGAFIVVRPANATLSQSYIGFHIIGEWR